MAGNNLTKQTSLPADEVLVRAVQFFSTESWRPTGQSARTATFEGRVPIPWFMLFCTFLGFLFCLLPGIIFYFMVIRQLRKFQTIVVTATTNGLQTEVSVNHPSQAKRLAKRFLESLS